MGDSGPLVSVVVPLAPAETAWVGLLEQLRSLPPGNEIILACPNAEPLSIALDWPANLPLKLTVSEPGRARQMNAGARIAAGKWLWFLHADSRLDGATLAALSRFMEKGIEGLGYFRLAFLNDGPGLTYLNAFGANLRARYLKLPFGDQGFILTADCFKGLGGYDEGSSFGEDHLLVWKARAAGMPLIPISAPLRTSARKYAQHGWFATTLRHARLTVQQAVPAWCRHIRRVWA